VGSGKPKATRLRRAPSTEESGLSRGRVALWLQILLHDSLAANAARSFTCTFPCWRGRARTCNLLIQSQAFCH
jgi:hypothetical protein